MIFPYKHVVSKWDIFVHISENENPSVDSPKTTKTTTTSGIQQKRDALKETIKNWSREDVRSWIRKIEFDHVITDDDVINNLNGNVLVQLWELKQKVK